MKNYIEGFFREFEYPAEAVRALTADYGQLANTPSSNSVYRYWLEQYGEDEMLDGSAIYDDMRAEIAKAGEDAGISPYAAQFLMYVSMTRHMRELYAERDIDGTVFKDTVLDLRAKLIECKKLHGTWGTFVGGWFTGFFKLTRFAFDRLQFEASEVPCDVEKDGVIYKQGSPAINVHIPSLGPLDHGRVVNSYRLAADFFRKRSDLFGDRFADDVTVFRCGSWLLFDKHLEWLPEESNLSEFIRDFKIIDTGFNEGEGDMWRVFYSDFTADYAKLPEDTLLQRCYKEWLLAGNRPGWGTGLVFMKNGVIF